jgi:mRNA interferase RelE/StbE
MKTEFTPSFAKDLKQVRDKNILRRIQEAIQNVKTAASLLEIKNLKRLRGEGHYYRIRLGDYRIGLVIEGNTVVFVRFLHRNEIYRHFP